MHVIEFAKFTLGLAKEIVKLYHETVGGALGLCYPGEWLFAEILKGLTRSNVCEFRFGSKLSMHSKLYFRERHDIPQMTTISFDFYPNTGSDGKEERDLEAAFEKAVDRLLLSTGLAIDPKDRRMLNEKSKNP